MADKSEPNKLSTLHESLIEHLKESLNEVVEGLVRDIANELDEALRVPDVYNSDHYGNVYYQGGNRELFKKLSLVDNSNVFTSQARELYEEFENACFYRPD